MAPPENTSNTRANDVERGGLSGLVRERLTKRLVYPAAFRVGLIVAPAGSGKSTLLGHVAEAHLGPVAWCRRANPVPRSDQALAAWLWAALTAAVDLPGATPVSVDELIDRIAASGGIHGGPVLVVADDLHLLEGSEAETALAVLVARLPPCIRLLLASRVYLALDLSRLRVSGHLVEIGPEDLRFRTWEVEQLFKDVYRDPLIPEDVGALARRTAGWAAYLQLFHLATNHKSVTERRRLLATLTKRGRLVQEYLTRHVLADLPEDLRDFLVRSSVLRRPSGPLCDELLGRHDSDKALAELERRQLFTERVDDDSYRYHTVLLSYLDARLVELLGVDGAREQHRRAAELLAREGSTEDAMAASARAEDWVGVARLLGHAGSHTGGLDGGWLEVLPPTVVDSDPWLLLVRARRALVAGALGEAISILRQAEAVAGSSAVAARCRLERALVAAWSLPDRSTATDWMGLVRSATQRDPRHAQHQAGSIPGATGRFAEGTAAFLAGDGPTAGRVLRAVALHPDAHPAMAAGARLMSMVADVATGTVPGPDELERWRDEIDSAGVPWLDRVTRALVVILVNPSEAVAPLGDLEESCHREGDRWGVALLALLVGLVALWTGRPASGHLERAAREFANLGAGTLEAWAQAYLAVAAGSESDADTAGRAAHQARTVAALLEVPGAAGVAALAMAAATGDDRDRAHAEKVLTPLGLWARHRHLAPEPADLGLAPLVATGQPPPTAAAGDRVRCLGGFELVLDSQAVDETTIKPMERAALHLLASRPGQPVHREEMTEALWPEAEPDAGRHRLQVAVSSLRRILGPRLVREGDAYRLSLSEGAVVDLWELDGGVRRASVARAGGDREGERAALEQALEAYRGPLLPADGPVEWLIRPREAWQSMAVGAAARLAAIHLEDNNPNLAGEAARAGLEIDRYRDDLWKVLIDAAEQSGHHAEAGQVRKAYQALLEELV